MVERESGGDLVATGSWWPFTGVPCTATTSYWLMPHILRPTPMVFWRKRLLRADLRGLGVREEIGRRLSLGALVRARWAVRTTSHHLVPSRYRRVVCHRFQHAGRCVVRRVDSQVSLDWTLLPTLTNPRVPSALTLASFITNMARKRGKRDHSPHTLPAGCWPSDGVRAMRVEMPKRVRRRLTNREWERSPIGATRAPAVRSAWERGWPHQPPSCARPGPLQLATRSRCCLEPRACWDYRTFPISWSLIGR